MPRLRFGQDDVQFELRGVRCGLPTTRNLAVTFANLDERIALFAPFELTPPASFLLTRSRISITL